MTADGQLWFPAVHQPPNGMAPLRPAYGLCGLVDFNSL